MKWLKNARATAAASRLLDEELYARVLHEIERGFRRDGLWAKALADGEGDEARAKALYIKYRVQSFKDEMAVLEKATVAQSLSSDEHPEPSKEEIEEALKRADRMRGLYKPSTS